MTNVEKRAKWGIAILSVLIIVLIYAYLGEFEKAERGEMYRQQLTALCSAINHADFESVSVRKDDIGSEHAEKLVFILFMGKEDFEAEGTAYTIYPDGRVIFSGHDAEGNSFQGDENWGDHPDFSFFKK